MASVSASLLSCRRKKGECYLSKPEVRKEPVLAPGEHFEYTSGCPLSTPFGSMEGTYQMVTSDGDRFDADIERFLLMEPSSIN